MPNSPKLLNAEQVGARLGVHPRTVKRLMARGMFPHAQRLGDAANSPYAIPESDVIAYEKKLASTPGGGKAS